jgi:hypothetical protein
LSLLTLYFPEKKILLFGCDFAIEDSQPKFCSNYLNSWFVNNSKEMLSFLKNNKRTEYEENEAPLEAYPLTETKERWENEILGFIESYKSWIEIVKPTNIFHCNIVKDIGLPTVNWLSLLIKNKQLEPNVQEKLYKKHNTKHFKTIKIKQEYISVFGSGPSVGDLSQEDFSLLKEKTFVIGTNYMPLKFEPHLIVPISQHSYGFVTYYKHTNKSSMEILFPEETLKKFSDVDEEFHWNYVQDVAYSAPLRDFKRFLGGPTTIQILNLLKLYFPEKKIILFGCDFNFEMKKMPKYYSYEFLDWWKANKSKMFRYLRNKDDIEPSHYSYFEGKFLERSTYGKIPLEAEDPVTQRGRWYNEIKTFRNIYLKWVSLTTPKNTFHCNPVNRIGLPEINLKEFLNE